MPEQTRSGQAAERRYPETGLARNDQASEIRLALDRLPAAQRRVLLLRYYGEMTFQEIADQLDCPLNTALSHARRGLSKLKEYLPATAGEELP